MSTDSKLLLRIGLNDKLKLWENIFYGSQHMILIAMAAINAPMRFINIFGVEKNDAAYLVGIMFVAAGLITITQSSKLLGLPVAQGQSIIPFMIMIPSVATFGLAATYAGMFVAGLIAVLLVVPFKQGIFGILRPVIAPPAVYGTLMVLMGISMIPTVALPMILNANTPPEQVSMNLLLAGIAFFVPFLINVFVKKGFVRSANVLFGLAAAILVAWTAGRIDATTMANTPWLNIPKLWPFGVDFSIGPVISIAGAMLIGYLIMMAECIGTYEAVAHLGGESMNRERTNRGLFGEVAGSALTTMFGSYPATSFAQNIGILTLTSVGARSVMTTCGIILVVLGFFYKIGAFITAIPVAVYGGLFLLTLGMLTSIGINILRKMEWTDRNVAVVGAGLAVGFGCMGLPQAWLSTLPAMLKLIISSPSIFGFLVMWVMYMLFVMLPDYRKSKAEKAGAAPAPSSAD